MSFIDKVFDFGKNIITGNGLGSQLAKTAGLAFLLNQVNKSVNKDNDKPNPKDPGVRVQLDPDTNHSIPVVYGNAYVKGIVTDAQLTNGNKTMWYCITLSERTGTKIDGTQSVISFRKIYWGDLLMTFSSDGITCTKVTDASGNQDTDINGLVKVYCFNNGSVNPVSPFGYTNGSLQNAYALFPNWTADHTMDNLVFALVRVDYNKNKNITGLKDMTFELNNTMYQAGDVLYDYMRSTRYGAGIADGEIYSQ